MSKIFSYLLLVIFLSTISLVGRFLLYLQNTSIFRSSCCLCFCCSGVISGVVKVIVDDRSFLNFAYLSFLGFTFFFLFLFFFFPINNTKTNILHLFINLYSKNAVTLGTSHSAFLMFLEPYKNFSISL